MRLIFEQYEDEHEQRLEALRASFDADEATPLHGLSDSALSPVDAATQFLVTFNPALAGMRWLVTERIDLLLPKCLKPSKVSVDLRACRWNMFQFASRNLYLFPAMMESVFNSIGSVAGPPLVIDTAVRRAVSARAVTTSLNTPPTAR